MGLPRPKFRVGRGPSVAVHKESGCLIGEPGPFYKHQDKPVAIRGFDTMHDTGRRKNHAAGFDGDILPIFERYDPFSLDDIKYLVLHGVLVKPGGLSRLETDKIADNTLGLHHGFADKFLFGKLGKIENFVMFYLFD